ncbi:Rieske (2Fe-2S) protein [Nocardia yamanashiensis]|uniref:Rieske (2Fe-2S) protein n=1 Tax=Nocardia yamanashiensis TaxID=209247 RepID=UPI000830898C|nr:Rieske (2Fe-2S) protein [Nocardia yamanashiensis]
MSPHASDPTRRAVLGGAAGLTVAAIAGCGPGQAAEQTGEGPFTVAAADIPVGGGKVFKDRATVVTQPNPGEFHAFSAKCTHRGCLVRDIAKGKILCPCHGSAFAVADGSVALGPAEHPLAARTVTVAGAELRIS